VRRIARYLPLLLLVLCSIQFAEAQSFFDVGIHFGAAQDKKASTGLDQNFISCSGPVAGSTTCLPTTALSSFMMGVDMNLILMKHLGAGFTIDFQPGKQTYANLNPFYTGLNLQSRISFYDIDAIYQPITNKKAALQLKGGLSVANLKFYENLTGANALVGNYNQSQYAGSSNHVGANGSLGVMIFFKGNWFIRPEFRVHYIRNLNQFGSNLVTNEMATVGYSWGDR
jgi:hypothetical protein